MNEIPTLLPSTDNQQTRLPLSQDSWWVPSSAAGLDAPFASVLSDTGLQQWDAYGSMSAQAPNAFAARTTADTAPIPPSTTDPQLERLGSTVLAGPEPLSRAELSTTVESPTTSYSSAEPTLEDHITDLQNYLVRQSQATKQLIQVFFSLVHPHWTILHAPTFEIETASDDLLGSMLMLASWLQGNSDHVKLVPLVLDVVTANLLVCLHQPTSPMDFD